MRALIAAAALAAFPLAASASGADAPATVPPLAPGEVLLEVNGLGVVRTPATLAIVTGTVTASGPTLAEARRRLQSEVDRFTGAARAAGVSPADIRVIPGASSATSLRVFDVEAPPPPGESAVPSPPEYHVESLVVVRLRNLERASDLQDLLTPEGESMLRSTGSLRYELIDDSAARRAARTQAIANARASAEDYAAAVGMRIGRMIRVTERAGLDFAAMMVTEIEAAQQLGERSAAQEAQVETRAIVGVDFALVPR
jgi:hypothetical protein